MSKSVLIVDYERRDADAVSRYLNEYGYRAAIVTQGEHVVRAFREGDFDLVLVNLLMPDVSGVEICKRLKSYEQGIRTPVYFLSPLATGHNMANRQNGAEGTLTKPINLGQVLEIAERHLGPGDPEVTADARRSATRRDDAAKRKDQSTASAAAEPASTKSARTVDSKPESGPGDVSSQKEGASRAKEAEIGVRRKADEKPSESGRIERTGMGRLIAQLGRGKSTGRLEIEIEGKRVAIRFDAGFIVGLGSGDFVPWLVRQGKLSEADADKVRELRQRRRGEVIEVLKSEKMLGGVEVDMLLDRWRIQALKDAVCLKLGDYKFFPGEVTRTIHVDPLILVHHHFKSLYAGSALASQVETDLRAAKPLFATGDPIKRQIPTDPDLALVLHAADAGASLAQIRELVPNSRDADAAVYALWLTGNVTQDPSAAWRVPTASPAATVEKSPARPSIEIPTEEPLFDLDVDPDLVAAEPASSETQNGFGDFEKSFDAEFEAEFETEVVADVETMTIPAPKTAASRPAVDAVDAVDAPTIFADEFGDLESDGDFVDPDFEGLTPDAATTPRSKSAPRVDAPGRRESTPADLASKSSKAERPEAKSVDELQAEIDGLVGRTRSAVAYVDDIAPDPHVTTEELLRRGDELMRDRVYSKAQDFFSEVVLREPKNAEAWTRLARAQYRNRFEDRLDRTLDAVRSCRKAVAVKQDFLGAYQTLIKIFEEENKPEIARSVALAAIEFHPGDEELSKRLRTIERRMKRATT
ncbi:MAG: response regulator [Deltaproteobacteria bacterium]|nr:response regulator [Deltaproteobacteria bacterium]